jgi:hypothetical protein
MAYFAPGIGGQQFGGQHYQQPYQQQQYGRPQGLWDDVNAMNTIVPIAVPIITALLSAAPQFQQQQQGFRPQAPGFPLQAQMGQQYQPMGPGGNDLGSLVNTIAPIVASLLSAGPQMQHQGFRAQAGFVPFQQQPFGYQQQSVWDDINNVTRVAVPIITALLSAGPTAIQAGFRDGGAQNVYGNPQVSAALQTLLASLQQAQQQGGVQQQPVQQQPQTVAAGAR